MHLKTKAAALTGRAVLTLSRFLGRGGTALPGLIAEKISPSILEELSAGVTTVLVTGTNGKTTTTALLYHMAKSANLPVFSNPSGSNLKRGLITEYLRQVPLFRRGPKPLAILEVDEGVLPTVAGRIQPRAIVVTNIFRDQLDRFGEVSSTAAAIERGLVAAPKAVRVINADCALTAKSALDAGGKLLTYGLDTPLHNQGETISDVPRCLNCGETWSYRFHTYAHLGDYTCPSCGFSRPGLMVAASKILSLTENETRLQIRVGSKKKDAVLSLPAIFNVYNALAALAGAIAIGIDPDSAIASLSNAQAGFGRMELLQAGSAKVRIILAKNPVGLARACDYLLASKEPFLPVFCLNDKINDGTDISWIWDAPLEELSCLKTEEVLIYGTRCEDMALRLRYAGFARDVLSLVHEEKELISRIQRQEGNVTVIANYTAMLQIREALAALAGEKSFWEGKE